MISIDSLYLKYYLKSIVKNSNDNQLIIKCLKEINFRTSKRKIGDFKK